MTSESWNVRGLMLQHLHFCTFKLITCILYVKNHIQMEGQTFPVTLLVLFYVYDISLNVACPFAGRQAGSSQCAWAQTKGPHQRQLSRFTGFCACITRREGERKMTSFSTFHNGSKKIYLFIFIYILIQDLHITQAYPKLCVRQGDKQVIKTLC